jgi:hypothetical protein
MENNMSKLVPVARRNPTVFVRSDLVASMEIVDYGSHAELRISLNLGTMVSERFDSLTEASEAAVRICNVCNEGK